MQITRRSFMAASALAVATFRSPKPVSAQGNTRKILFIASPASHGYGEHEHPAGCSLLADRLNAVGGIEAEVVVNWPEDESIIYNADAVIIYADGGQDQIIKGRGETLQKLTESKTGIGIMHWALDPPKNQRRAVYDAIGGFFALNWSVNPMWTAECTQFSEHPVTNGVKPFTIRDEWYYHMKFAPKNITPLLSVLPPVETLVRRDGPYSNNTYVRKAVLAEKRPQHLAWAYTRKNGGRGFGFTGGHFHINWANDNYRKLILNAAAWLAGIETPQEGIQSKTPGYEELFEPLGEPPKSFNPEKAKEQLQEWKSNSGR